MLAALFRQHVYPDTINRQIHGLRGLAALIVFVFHIYGIADEWHFWPASLAGLGFFFRTGRHGVEIFFIISGYLITASLLRHRNAGQFLIDRCIRIYPVFLTIHLLVFGLGPLIGYGWLRGIGIADWLTNFLSNLLFLPGLFDLPLAQPSAWSLSYEAAFYLTAALLYVVGRRGGRPLGMLAAVLIATPLIALYPKAVFFLAGAAVFHLQAIRRLKGPWLIVWTALPALAAALVILTVGETVPDLDYAAALPAFLFFWGIVDGAGHLSALLRRGFLQYLGTISYSFYLWFGVVTYPVKLIVAHMLSGTLGPALSVIAFAAISFVASILVAQVSNVLLEVRLGRWLRTRGGSVVARATA